MGRSFHVEQALREDRVAVAAASEAASAAAPSPLGGREHLRAAWRPPWKLFMQQNVSLSLSPGGGQPGFAEIHAPLALHLSSCADSFRILFKKTSCLRPMLATEKILEGGIGGRSRGGRICIGCAGFRAGGCWECRFRRSDFPAGGGPRAIRTRFPGTQS